MASLIELIERYGLEREVLGAFVIRAEDMGGEGDHKAEAEAIKDTLSQKDRADKVMRSIRKLLGMKGG